MRARRPPHPLEHHPSFRAVIAAAPALAELATRLRTRERASRATRPPDFDVRAWRAERSGRAAEPGARTDASPPGPPPPALADRSVGPTSEDLVGALALACGDLADGFAAPPLSRKRITAHHRAWITVREIDRAVTVAARRRLAPAEIVQRAQRAIDRADVLIGALLPA